VRGSIRQRTEGSSFTAYWFATDPGTGKRVQHSRGGFKTKGAAQKHLNAILPKLDAGTWRADQSITVTELLEQWIAAKASEGLRIGTLALYEDVVGGWLKPYIGGLKVTQLSPKVAGELVAKLRSPEGSRHGRGALSDRSVQLAITVLKAATRWASESGLMSHDVLVGFKRPRIDPSDRVSSAWSAEEARQFLASANDDRLRAAFWLLLTRGLRRGEVCGLRWDDIDLDAGRARIVRTRIMVDRHPVESDPKTKAGVRAIPLDHQLVAELRAHRKRQLEERMAAGEAWQDSGYVLTDELGVPLLPQTLSRRFNAAVTKSGLRRIRLHDGRHTAATGLLENGTPVHIVSRLLGHSRASITLDVYAHAIDGGGEVAGEQWTAMLTERAVR
jgi:integrase